MTCPGSVVLCQGMPEKSSPFAEEGTQAHTLAESMLKCKDYEAPQEMIDHVRVYVSAVKDLVTTGCKLHTEVQVKVTEQVWGTADAIVWDPSEKTLYVRDLKYGAGVGVEVTDNLQLKIYALAALLTMGYPAETINVGIIQPRFPHADGASRNKDYDSVDLLEFYGELTAAEARVNDAASVGGKGWNDVYLTPSEKGCRWCLAAPKCPKLKTKAQTVAKKVFAADLPYDPKDLSDTLDFLPILEGWIKNVREFAYTEAEKGNAIPDYKLVPKVASRKWAPDIDLPGLAFALAVPKQELFKTPELKTVTELQKLARGKNDKERQAVLDPFVVKESSGHTLVHESDKRDAVRVDAKSAFTTAGETVSR